SRTARRAAGVGPVRQGRPALPPWRSTAVRGLWGGVGRAAADRRRLRSGCVPHAAHGPVYGRRVGPADETARRDRITGPAARPPELPTRQPDSSGTVATTWD